MAAHGLNVTFFVLLFHRNTLGLWVEDYITDGAQQSLLF